MFKNIFQKSRFCQNIANLHTNHDSKKLKILCLKKSIQKIFVIVLQSCEQLKFHYSTQQIFKFWFTNLKRFQMKSRNKKHKKHFLKISWYTFWLKKKSMWKIKTHEYSFAESRNLKKRVMSRYKFWQHILLDVKH